MIKVLKYLQKLFPASCHEQIFLVGGSVRDFLLGKASEDIDLVAALPDEILRQCGFHPVAGKTTVPIWFQCVMELGKIEVIQLENSTLLHDDLLRRDFTLNAIIMRLSGELYDPLHGEEDLRKGRLQVCSDDTFRDDPLRIFRAFRFESAGWRMTVDTEALIRRDDWTLKLNAIPVERFSREMVKSLAAVEPERFFKLMLDFNIGTEWLPELFQMAHIPAGPLEHHPEGDLFTHSIQVLNKVSSMSSDTVSRFCAFFHDIGKLATDPVLYPKHHGHDETGFNMALDFCNRLFLPATYRKALSWTSRLHSRLNNWDELRDSTKIRIAEQAAKAGIAITLPLVAVADKPGNTPHNGWEKALDVAAMTTAELGIEVDKLTAMPEQNRASFILQKRVDMLRQLLIIKHVVL